MMDRDVGVKKAAGSPDYTGRFRRRLYLGQPDASFTSARFRALVNSPFMGIKAPAIAIKFPK